MNRKNLTAAVLAGLAGAAGIVGSAQAVNINPDGLGQVLIYPYYTTNAGNLTILSVVNTSDEAKAVKVRFLEGENSREVLDFNLYMSKYDVWTASIRDVDGTPTLKTTDTSCTVPYIYGNGGEQDFLPWALDDAGYNDLSYTDKMSKEYDDISRGAEGHFEMIEMGTLINGEARNDDWVDITLGAGLCDNIDDSWTSGPDTGYGDPLLCVPTRTWTPAELAEKKWLTPYGSATAATHKNGVPKDCQQLVDAWTYGASPPAGNGYWLDDNFYDIEAPSGGLFGGAAIVNVGNGTMYSYDAKAIDGFYGDDKVAKDDSHQEPGTIFPSLDSGGNGEGIVFLNGDDENAHMDRGVDAVSYVFMHDALMNEYTTESIVGAGTEWVITFPTKQFYVHKAFLDDYEDYRDNEKFDGSDWYTGPMPRDPFLSTWTWVNTTYTSEGDVKKPGYVNYPCEVVQLDTIWDREERTIVDPDAPPGTPTPPIVSPAPPPIDDPDPDGIIPFELCYETSVIEFGPERAEGEVTAILGSSNFHNIDNTLLDFEFGWARLDMVNASWDKDGSGVIGDCCGEIEFRDNLGGLYGLPVTGFAVQRFVNAFLGEGADVLANYGGIFQHKYTRSMGSG